MVVEVVGLYPSDETIAATRVGFDEGWTFGGITQHLAKAGDGGVQSVVKVAVVISGPERLPQLIASDQIAGRFKQDPEHLEWLSGEPQAAAFLSKFLGMEVKFEVAKSYASADRDYRRSHFSGLQRI